MYGESTNWEVVLYEFQTMSYDSRHQIYPFQYIATLLDICLFRTIEYTKQLHLCTKKYLIKRPWK